LPIEVDASKAETSFENGIVRLVLPKAASAKPQRIAVRVLNGNHAEGTPALSEGSRRKSEN
jgi:hypothetical protein